MRLRSAKSCVGKGRALEQRVDHREMGQRDTAEGKNPGPKTWNPVRSPLPRHKNLLFYYPVACHASAPNMAKACVTSLFFLFPPHTPDSTVTTLPCRLQIGTALLDLIIIDISSNNYQYREIIPPCVAAADVPMTGQAFSSLIPTRNGPSQSPTRLARSNS